MLEDILDQYDFSSERSLSSFTSNSTKFEEEEEENIEEEVDLNLSNQSVTHLHCHPDEPLPPVAISMCCQLFHPECNRCNQCSKQITKGKYFLKEIDSCHNMQILCMECAQQIDKIKKICSVCREEIKNEEISNKNEKKNKAVELKKGFFVHKECMHCQICGFSKNKSFQCIINKTKTKTYIICLDCASIMNGGRISKNMKPFVGRFIEEILPPTFNNQCQQCHKPLICNGFVFANQKILCTNCGITFFQTKKKNQKT